MVELEASNFLRITDPDRPIYRIFPLWHLEEVMRLNQLSLVQPARWEDPFEVLPQRIQVVDKRTVPGRVEMLHAHLHPVFAQCWSNTKESDTLLRAYSRVVKHPHHRRNMVPSDEGVQVRSSPRKLLRALATQFPHHAEQHCFVGAIQYGSEGGLKKHIANLVGSHEPAVLGRGRPLAELHLLKRMAFRHESEIRLIYIAERSLAGTDFLTCPINVNDVFEEITFDPRLESFEHKEREAVFRALGYSGHITPSELYRGLLMEVILDPSHAAKH